jgi:two-component system chemotaxis response regulator CheB
MSSPIRVLVVDDSALMRKMVTEMLSQDDGIAVVGQARDGADALTKVEALRPDVVTMDVEMPVMDGVAALAEIMQRHPTPVVMLSSLTQQGAEMTLRCLDGGAIDVVGKPGGSISLNIAAVAADLIAKVKVAARVRLKPLGSSHPAPEGSPHPAGKNLTLPSPSERRGFPEGKESYPRPSLTGNRPSRALLIGSSTGGPRALQVLIPALPATLGIPVVIVQHMPPGFTASLAQRLNAASPLCVREATVGDRLEPGVALVAPGGYHLEFDAQGRVVLTEEPPIHGVRPAVDVTLASLTHLFNGNLTAVLLTGMGRDGARGLKSLRDRGGRTLAEDESTCVVYGMPRAAQELGGVERLLPLHQLADALTEILGKTQ